MWTIHVYFEAHGNFSHKQSVLFYGSPVMFYFSVIFTINPLKQLRLLKSELSLEVSEMIDQPPSTNQNQGREDFTANQCRYIPDNSAGENKS